MTIITGNIKDILSIKMKPRHDDVTDQFSRIFMAKIFLISSLIMSVDFFSDKVSCIVPGDSSLSRDFVHSACWIQGFYIYEEMRYRFSESGYFGIPKDVELDGIYPDGKLCRRLNKASHLLDEDCKEMTKTFYIQFQYFPFYVASIAIMFYMPYILFRIINADIISLRDNLKAPSDTTAEKLVQNYFDYSMNGGKGKLRMRVGLNVCVKIFYVLVNVMSFVFTDDLLNGNFKSYGLEWLKWSKLNNSLAFAYTRTRAHPKPGNMLLPAMGFCDITEGVKDVRHSFTNYNKFICEISPHILYQYVLVVLWFLLIISIVISNIGVLINMFSLSYIMLSCRESRNVSRNTRNIVKRVRRNITIREIEYLQFIRVKNLAMFGEVVRLLQARAEQRYAHNFEVHETRQRSQHQSFERPSYGKQTSLLLRNTKS
ncbi:innexin inx3-like [Clytia hemisphaerica]|uniref:innexin inx3-like n=1 Tax=Clytia hemisphaerica TaxID=252671 RepID=UPI0034D5DAF8|eukprot:TCONS_00001207-protein